MDETFARYLIGELRWELEQCDIEIAELREFDAEQIEVLSYVGYKSLRIRVSSTIFDVYLSWRGDAPPTIERVSSAPE